jgi:hypothetical protein
VSSLSDLQAFLIGAFDEIYRLREVIDEKNDVIDKLIK